MDWKKKAVVGGCTNKKPTEGGISTFIGVDAEIEGVLRFSGTIRIDGKMKGKIESRDGVVIVGEKAVVDADLFVDVAKIMGRVNGVIEAGSRIEILPPGTVMGDIQAPVVSIDAGVKFNGNCVMKGRKGSMEADGGLKETGTSSGESKIQKFPINL